MEPKPIDYSLVENLNLEKYRREYYSVNVKVGRVFWTLALSTHFMDLWKVLEDTDLIRDLFFDFYKARNAISNPYLGCDKIELRRLLGSNKEEDVKKELENQSANLLAVSVRYHKEFNEGKSAETPIALDFADHMKTKLPSPSYLFRRIAKYIPDYDGGNKVTVQHPILAPTLSNELMFHLPALVKRNLFLYFIRDIEAFLNSRQNTFSGKILTDSPISAVRQMKANNADFMHSSNRQIAKRISEMYCIKDDKDDKKGVKALNYDSIMNAVATVKTESKG